MNNASGKTTAPGTRQALSRALRSFLDMLPIVMGMLLLTSLILTWLPWTRLHDLFGRHEALDVLIAAALGSIAAGHPVAGYILGGELLAGGVGLAAVTALIVTWVTVGMVQLPAEALLLGRRFALARNLICFLSAIAIAWLTVAALRILG